MWIWRAARWLDTVVGIFPAIRESSGSRSLIPLSPQPSVASSINQIWSREPVSARTKPSLAEQLIARGIDVVSGGTDNHVVLLDLRGIGMTGKVADLLVSDVHITANKNAVYGDRSAMSPGGIRLGAPALTSRGFKEADFEKVAEFLDKAIVLALEIQQTSGKMLKDFKKALDGHEGVVALEAEVHEFARGFPMPGLVPDGCTAPGC